jgi:hypothetical protein
LLAVEDTTVLSYRHAVAHQLGVLSHRKDSSSRGWYAHSVLLLQAQGERTLGLIEQRLWMRSDQAHGQKHERHRRAYEDKESYKWQAASERMSERLGPAQARTISVCDRESDVYEYLQYKHRQGQRYVVRARADRPVQGEADGVAACAGQTLFARLEHGPLLGHKAVDVAQRGGRVGRQVKVELRAAPVTLCAPQRRAGAAGSEHSPGVPAYAVLVRQVGQGGSGQEGLCWRLLTSEPVHTLEQAQRVVRFYELRWRIEEFHKAWKSGVGVERQRLQSAGNLQRMAVVLAFVAARLMALKEALHASAAQQESCEVVLERAQWRGLWVSVERSRPPEQAPSAAWAWRAIARLGCFKDTKRTGRPGWATIWDGWLKLQQHVATFELASYIHDEKM